MNTADSGYAIFHAVFAPARMREICDALKSVDLHRTKAGARRVLGVRAIQTLATEPDLASLAGQFLEERPIPFRATFFDKSATSNWLVAWHQDTTLPLSGRVEDPAWGPWTVKGGILHANAPAHALEQIVALRVHLDDWAESNGPLRVLPGTHASGVLTHDAIQRAAGSVRPVDCVASAGGVVAMRPLVVHASSKSTDERPRRVLHIEYAASVPGSRRRACRWLTAAACRRLVGFPSMIDGFATTARRTHEDWLTAEEKRTPRPWLSSGDSTASRSDASGRPAAQAAIESFFVCLRDLRVFVVTRRRRVIAADRQHLLGRT